MDCNFPSQESGHLVAIGVTIAETALKLGGL